MLHRGVNEAYLDEAKAQPNRLQSVHLAVARRFGNDPGSANRVCKLELGAEARLCERYHLADVHVRAPRTLLMYQHLLFEPTRSWSGKYDGRSGERGCRGIDALAFPSSWAGSACSRSISNSSCSILMNLLWAAYCHLAF